MKRLLGKPVPTHFEHGGIFLRPLTVNDLSATLEWRNRDGVRQQFVASDVIGVDAHRAWFEKYLQKEDDVVFLAFEERNGPPIGQLAIYCIEIGRRQAEVGRFIAAPGMQGAGKMRRALECLMAFASKELGLAKLVLSVRDSNARALGLYRKVGFAETSRSDGMVLMARDL
jgi:RimJ/RimL family protein N-acetyltransferase